MLCVSLLKAAILLKTLFVQAFKHSKLIMGKKFKNTLSINIRHMKINTLNKINYLNNLE